MSTLNLLLKNMHLNSLEVSLDKRAGKMTRL